MAGSRHLTFEFRKLSYLLVAKANTALYMSYRTCFRLMMRKSSDSFYELCANQFHRSFSTASSRITDALKKFAKISRHTRNKLKYYKN